MAERYARIDVNFMHKRTADKLRNELGPLAQLAFLALILRSKDGATPGTFVYSTDAIGWEKLGLDPDRDGIPFTLDEFFRLTGRLRQTSRTHVGRLTNVKLTRYEQWQKDARRYEERVKKSRTRRKSTGDTTGDTIGDTTGDMRGTKNISSSNASATPKPPLNGKTFPCSHPRCTKILRTAAELAGHLEDVHGVTAAESAAADDFPATPKETHA